MNGLRVHQPAPLGLSPWMFPTSTGTLIEVVAVGQRFLLVLRKAGLPAFRLYELRHTYATHLLAAEAPITYVAAQLVHAKPTTTLAHYVHWIPQGEQELSRSAGGSPRG